MMKIQTVYPDSSCDNLLSENEVLGCHKLDANLLLQACLITQKHSTFVTNTCSF